MLAMDSNGMGGNYFGSAIPVLYFQEIVPQTTHVFLASVKHSETDGRVPIAYAMFGPDSADKDNTIVLYLIVSRKLVVRTEKEKETEAWKKRWEPFMELEYDDEPRAAFAARGKDYDEFMKEFRKLSEFSTERRPLVLGLGIMLMCESMKFFSSNSNFTHMRLEAAHSRLIPYYAKFGFEEAPVGVYCTKENVIAYMQGSSQTTSGTINMLLCDMRGTGQHKACEWAKSYMQQSFPLEFWDAVRHSDAWQENRVFVTFCVSCGMQPATLQCGAPNCGGKGASYCGKKCQEKDWTQGDHSLFCGLSAEKAAEILHHGSVRGHKLTEKQRRYMAWKRK
jgi:hypothetical protein